jgi:hypothetical protein
MDNEEVRMKAKFCRNSRISRREEKQRQFIQLRVREKRSRKMLKVFTFTLVCLIVSTQFMRAERLWFREDGDLYVTSQFFHVSLEIDVTQLTGTSHFRTIMLGAAVKNVHVNLPDYCVTYRDELQNLRAARKPFQNRLEAEAEESQLSWGETKLNHSCSDLRSIVMHKRNRHGHRKRRQAVALAAAAAGAFVFHEIELALGWNAGADTQAHLERHDATLRAVIAKLESHDRILRQLTSTVEDFRHKHWREMRVQHVLEAIDALCATAERIMRGTEAAREGRLSGDLLPPWRVKQLLELAIQKGQYLPIAMEWEVYQFPCTLMHTAKGLQVVVHCPVSQHKMELMWMHTAPVLVEGKMVQLLGQDNRFIAVNRQANTFVEGPQKELRLCFRVQNALFCRHLVTRTDPSETCLAAIAFNRQEAMAQKCRWRKVERDWTVIATQDTTQYAVATTSGLSATIACASKARPTRAFLLKPGWSNVTVHPGCELTTPKFRLEGRQGQAWRASAVMQFGEVLLQEISKEVKEDELSDQIEEIEQQLDATGPIDTSGLEVRGSDLDVHHVVQYVALALTVVIMMIVCTCKRRCKKRAPGTVKVEMEMTDRASSTTRKRQFEEAFSKEQESPL